MASTVTLPRLGQGMEVGTIVRWLRSEGDRVTKGDPLYELDTDKTTQEVEAEVSGVLMKILVHEGEHAVGTAIGWIGEQGEEIPATAADEAGAAAERQPPGAVKRTKAPVAEPAAAAPAAAAAGRIKVSPLARRIARERGIDLAALVGTGPEGRIVVEDAERPSAATPAAPDVLPTPAVAADSRDVERIPLSSTRRTIARRLTEAWTAPAFQISTAADMTRAEELRARLVDRYPDERPTITDLLTKVCAIALMQHRAVNALYADDAIVVRPSANIGLAVASARGLIVPVISGCERKTIAEIAAARIDLVARAREGKLGRADLQGGTFTISNLGMFGVDQFIAVLNPPQAAILATGAIEDRPVARNGRVVVRPMLTMTLTCDHRVVDGAVAADFLRMTKRFLEEPSLML
jgi:pyruvate dehydrogenase E2 component (dihydrolipoyllysine-residue acetyltransferase)